MKSKLLALVLLLLFTFNLNAQFGSCQYVESYRPGMYPVLCSVCIVYQPVIVYFLGYPFYVGYTVTTYTTCPAP